MPIDSLKLNEERRKGAPFANPRNAAAGSLLLDSAVTAQRNLNIIVFNIQQIRGVELTKHTQGLDFLKELGFRVSPIYKAFTDINIVYEEIKAIGENEENLHLK